jgi:hypothetical protein
MQGEVELMRVMLCVLLAVFGPLYVSVVVYAVVFMATSAFRSARYGELKKGSSAREAGNKSTR